ncbi:pilus assembly protein [Nocardioides iriomotensis]|uniref:Pilus assembly protein n=2 Tax=Nocardioides iriomotensis TaxID=715784 RepID=A0A4Q5J3C2_9ACTN|nr:pilus assembly protein [Nocardioides iriomotensis]
MAVEVVILTPVLMMFVMLIAACGRYVAVQGDIQATARDAVRAASLERTVDAAHVAATRIVQQSLDDGTTCRPLGLSGFAAGGVVRVDLDCEVSYRGLGLIGLPGSVRVQTMSQAPIDIYRRTG